MKETYISRNKEENFVDYIGRLFPYLAENEEGKKNITRTVTIQVTDSCNLRCTYCYQINKSTHSISLNTACKFIDDVLDGKYDSYCDYTNSPGIVLEFIGGEPLLQIGIIDTLTDYFVQGLINRDHPLLWRYRISICSNGTLYFNEDVQNYIKKNSKNLSFAISIDGDKELHDSCRIFPDGTGSYDMAIKAVKDYRKNYGASIGSKMTLAPSNISYLTKAVKGLINSGYKDINLNCVYEEGWTAEHAKIMYQQLKDLGEWVIENQLYRDIFLSIFDYNFFAPKNENDNDNWCGGNGQMLSVDWRGDLYPCIRYMESSLGTEIKPLIIGNVDTGILATEEQKECDKCLKCITRRSQSTDECFNCPIANGCSWCTAYNYQVFGTPDKRATFICIMHKARALANYYYWNKIFRIEDNTKRMKIYIPKEWALEIIDEDEWKLLKWLESPEQI